MTNVPNQPPPPAPVTPPPAPMTPPPASDLSADVRNMAMLAHLLGIVGFLGPLIIWLIKKADHPFIDQEGKESLNWQITVLIAFVPLFILRFIPFIGCVVGLLIPALWIANLVFCIMGAMKAKDGIPYKYPINFRFIK